MELSIRSFETTVPFKLQDVYTIFMLIIPDLFLTKLYAVAVESEFALSTIRPYTAPDFEIRRINTVRQVEHRWVFNISQPIYRLLVLVGGVSAFDARLSVSGIRSFWAKVHPTRFL